MLQVEKELGGHEIQYATSSPWLEGIPRQSVGVKAVWKAGLAQRYTNLQFLQPQVLPGMYTEGFISFLEPHQHGFRTVPSDNVHDRLKSVNKHFQRKAADVLGDEDAVWLLVNLYQLSSINIADIDVCRDGISLARLTAANFCEIGANSVYITEAGQGFIESIDQK